MLRKKKILQLIFAMVCIFAYVVESDAVSLTLTNPGFETGDFMGWKPYNYVPPWKGGSNPYISYQWPAHPDNMYSAGTWGGYIQDGTDGHSGFRQGAIPMPNADDVRWSFWVRPYWQLYSGHMNVGGYISITDETGKDIVWNIYADYYSGDFHFHFEDTLPTGWTMVPTIKACLKRLFLTQFIFLRYPFRAVFSGLSRPTRHFLTGGTWFCFGLFIVEGDTIVFSCPIAPVIHSLSARKTG